MSKAPAGFVIYNGPSLLDGQPIIVVAITKTTNEKTGNMVQTYILRADVEPHKALLTGEDSSVCGDCKHRPANGGACYVRVFQGPLSVYRAFHRGNYVQDDGAKAAREASKGRMVRLGTYGDPMAVPAEVWETLTSDAEGRTGYSHQWRNADVPQDQRDRVMRLCMASADDITEAAIAHASGLRYFRIRTAQEAVGAKEFMCPASAEAGKRTTCAEWGACNGTERTGKASPVIIVHGPTAVRFAKQRALAVA